MQGSGYKSDFNHYVSGSLDWQMNCRLSYVDCVILNYIKAIYFGGRDKVEFHKVDKPF